MAQGACKGKTEDFFPARGVLRKTPYEICNKCPVCDECLEYALKLHDVVGVWGGTSGRTRRRIRRERIAAGERMETSTVGLNLPGSWRSSMP